MLTIPFPSILVPTVQRWALDARTRSGGETVNGREQVVSSGLSRWKATLSFPLINREMILAFRAWITQMDGRANKTLIGPCDCSVGNRLAPMLGGIPHSDGTFHSDGAGYAQGAVPAETVGAVTAGANTVRIYNGSTELPILTGSFIGLAGFLYVITSATPQPNGETILGIMPKLRSDVPDGSPVEWCHARAPMRLVSDDSGGFDLNLGRYGNPTVDLVEVW